VGYKVPAGLGAKLHQIGFCVSKIYPSTPAGLTYKGSAVVATARGVNFATEKASNRKSAMQPYSGKKVRKSAYFQDVTYNTHYVTEQKGEELLL
jgi:hypothetical protein